MQSYNTKGLISEDNYNMNKKKFLWPNQGAGAAELVKSNFRVIIASDLFAVAGFKAFYQEWISNIDTIKKQHIYISDMELKDSDIPCEYSRVNVLHRVDCNDYLSFFKNMKGRESWVFLTGNTIKAEDVIKASRETGIYLRVYRLDRRGKLSNIKVSNYVKSVFPMNSFEVSDTIAHFRKVNRNSSKVPKKGEYVYTSKNTEVKLGEEFISNPQSITYQTDIAGVQAKIYQNQWLSISYFEDKAKKMLEKPIHYKGICWPTDLIYNSNGEFVGILVPAAEGFQLKQQLMSQQGLEKYVPGWDRRNITRLLETILDKIVFLHDRNILFGLVNPGAIFVKDESEVFFVEMDTYQIEGYPILSYERVMLPPELQEQESGLRLYTKQQDNYEVALLVFMLLMPGKFPYNKGNYEDLSESIKNKAFAFRYGTQADEHGAREQFGLWRFAWSHLGNDLKQAFYYTFQQGQRYSFPEKRRDARFWRSKIRELEKELNNPYDLESIKIFPRTFKRYSGTKTIQCAKCGIAHPDFYYRYPEKKICNSCLAKPSQTYFVCKTCRKPFYYDLGTLFKYEKLVETKGFSMPTHCPYCRSDKKQCVACGKMVPAYRINDRGLCYECEKSNRERIVSTYFCSCGEVIELTQGEVEFYMNKFGRLPVRCKKCRENQRKKL